MNYKKKIHDIIKKILNKFNLQLSFNSKFLELLKGNNITFQEFVIKKINKNQIKEINNFLKKIIIIDSGYQLIRIGENYDGGYLVPNILNEIDFCFSAGVGQSASFEDHLSKFGCQSFLVDGTVNNVGRHNFIKKNLNIFNNKKNITLDSCVNSKIEDKFNDRLLLQMDIEGSEVEILCNTNSKLLNRFKIMIIEFHNFHDIINSISLKFYKKVFFKILKTHYIVHIHPNNTSRILNINNNNISNIFEITFVNKKISKYSKKISNNLPHKLDQKNNEHLPEVKCPDIFYR
jgi:hypothetical protein